MDPTQYEIGKVLVKIDETLPAMEAKIREALAAEKQALEQQDPVGAKMARDMAESIGRDILFVEKKAAEKRQQALDLVATGKFNGEGPTSVPQPGPDAALAEVPAEREKLKAHLSFGLGVKPEEIDLDSGVDAGTRFKAAFFRPEKKLEFSQSQVGADNVVPVNIKGSAAVFVRQNGKLVLADEQGFDLKDVADAAGGTVSEGAKIAGAVGAAALGSGMNPIGASIAAAAGYDAAGTAVDSLANAAFDVDEPFSDVLGRNSLEAMAGIPFDIGAGVVSNSIAKRVGKKAARGTAVDATEAAKRLAKRGTLTNQDAQFIDFLTGGTEYQTMQRLQAGQKHQFSKLGRAQNRAYKNLQAFQESAQTGGRGLGKELYRRTADDLFATEKGIIDQIRQFDGNLAAAMDRDLQKRIGKVTRGDVPPAEELGNTIRNLVKEGEDTAIRLERDAYEDIFRQADQQGVLFDPDETANFIQSAYAKNQARPGENTVVERTVNELRQRKANEQALQKLRTKMAGTSDPAELARLQAEAATLEKLSGPLNARQFRQLFKTIRDEAPAGQLVAPSDSAFQGRSVSDAMNSLFQAKLPDPLRTAWNDATARLQHRMQFEVGPLGAILKEEAGGTSKLTADQVIARTLSDPAYTRNIINTASSVDPAAGAQLRSQLQRTYLHNIGVGRDIGTGYRNFDFDEGMVRELWGVNKKGEVNERYGDLMIEKLKRLNQHVTAKNIPADKIDEADIYELSNVLSADGVRETIDIIGKRAAERAKQQEMLNNEMMKMALSAARHSADGGTFVMEHSQFPRVIFDEKVTSRVAELVKRMPPADRATLKTDVMAHFFQRYANEVSSDMSNGYVPWHAKNFLLDLKRNPAMEKNLRSIIGDSEFEELLDVSKVADVMRPVKVTGKMPVEPRAVTNTEKASVYLAGDIPGIFRGHYLALSYSTGNMMKWLRSAMNHRVDPETAARNFKIINSGMLTASGGLQQAFLQGRNDPAFMEWLGSLTGIADKPVQDSKEFRQQYPNQR